MYEEVVLEYLDSCSDLWPDWSQEIKDLINYIDRTWIGDLLITRNRNRKEPLFAHALWNKWSEISYYLPTTNNANEAFNKQFSQTMEARASLWTIISGFIREDALARKTLLDAASGANNSNRASLHRQKDSRQRIKTMTEMYGGFSAKEYMKGMAGILSCKE